VSLFIVPFYTVILTPIINDQSLLQQFVGRVSIPAAFGLGKALSTDFENGFSEFGGRVGQVSYLPVVMDKLKKIPKASAPHTLAFGRLLAVIYPQGCQRMTIGR
jgi:hypothetical protein